jgi:hypothetical protein
MLTEDGLLEVIQQLELFTPMMERPGHTLVECQDAPYILFTIIMVYG